MSFKKIIFFVMISFVMMTGISSALNVNVSGYVTEDSVGLEGVTVTDNESIDTTTSNATGYYYLEGYTNQTSYILTASKTGYVSNTLEIDFLEVDLENEDIALTKTTLTGFLSDVTSILTTLTALFIAVMVVFMEPPLSIFIGIVVFVFVIGIIGRYLKNCNRCKR